MPSTIRVQILRLCAQFVAGNGSADYPLAVIIRVPDFAARLRTDEPEWGAPVDPEDCPPMVRAIMEAAGPAPIPSKALARKAGYEYSPRFRTHIARLVNDGFLRRNSDGLFRPDAEQAEPEE